MAVLPKEPEALEELKIREHVAYGRYSHQLAMLEVLQELNKQEKRTIIMVIHDLNHAARFSDYMVAIRNGGIIKEGTPNEVMRAEVLQEFFQIDAEVVADPRTNKPVCITYDLLTKSAIKH